MAVTSDRAQAASAAISVGDELLLYATRGAFHNPRRDRGRIFGRAHATTPVEELMAPVALLDREFTSGFAFELDALAPPHQGVNLAELIRRLSTFPNKKGWAMRLRRPLVTLTPEDAHLLRKRLLAEVGETADLIRRYVSESRSSVPAG